MWRFMLMLLPITSWSADYFECTSPQGVKSYQIDRCEKGSTQNLIRDDKAPKTYHLDASGQPMTTQTVKAGLNYYGIGYVNNKPYRMIVDTGASFVSMSRDQALQSGIPLRGSPMRMQTANGIVQGLLSTAESVSFAGHEVKNVQVVIQTEGRPYPGVLLGMSYLKNFDLNMSGAVMSMTRK